MAGSTGIEEGVSVRCRCGRHSHSPLSFAACSLYPLRSFAQPPPSYLFSWCQRATFPALATAPVTALVAVDGIGGSMWASWLLEGCCWHHSVTHATRADDGPTQASAAFSTRWQYARDKRGVAQA